MTAASDTRRLRRLEKRNGRPKPKQASALITNLEQMRAEGGGVVSIQILRREDVADLLAAAASDEKAHTLLTAVSQAIDAIERAPAISPALCAICPAPLRDGRFSLVIAIPECDVPSCCVFRRIPAGHSDRSQPVIPTEASHPFRGIPATPE